MSYVIINARQLGALETSKKRLRQDDMGARLWLTMPEIELKIEKEIHNDKDVWYAPIFGALKTKPQVKSK